jgi:hypothetical protein
VNVHDKFWGPCEVADMAIKRFIEVEDCIAKADFIACDREFTGDMFTKHQFDSKPKFFILHRGNVLHCVDGLDFPKLSEEILKSFPLLDEI